MRGLKEKPMKRKYATLRGARRQRGAVTVLFAIALVAILGFAALCVDWGYMLYSQRRLQAATDAAALAGAADLWSQSESTAYNDAMAYTAGNNNSLPGNVTVSTATITPLQLNSVGLPYKQATSGYNAMKVTQSATVPVFFARIFGKQTMPISATSVAAAGGAGGPAKYNVEIILDTTHSMNDTDSNCVIGGKTQTRLACAKAGALQLLSTLTNAGDNVGLMAFPPQSSNYNFTCSTSSQQPGIASSYSNAASAGYAFSSAGTGYLSSNGTTNTGSGIVQALGGGSCSGLQAPGGLGTFYAQAIAAAQSALTTVSSSQSPPGQNVIILLSDGDASSSTSQLGNTYQSTYGSECAAAVTTATTAKTAGTLIYTIAYIGGETADATCSDGSDSATPCGTMLSIASGPSYFYSDTCTSAQGGTANLSSIFSGIAYSLTKPRLIPLGAT
jgi:Flp pilus assembly protein TadG